MLSKYGWAFNPSRNNLVLGTPASVKEQARIFKAFDLLEQKLNTSIIVHANHKSKIVNYGCVAMKPS